MRESRAQAELDNGLVERAIAGERKAFAALYEAHVDQVYRFIRFRVSDEHEAADLTQDVFVRAFRGVGGLRQPNRFGAWLMRIAHSLVLNHRRSASRRPRTVELPNDEPDAPNLPSEDEPRDPTDRVVDRVSAQEVLAAVAGLTDSQQQVIALRFVAGLTLAETADVVGRTEDAVKKLQRRGLATLRQIMTERGE